MVICLNNHVSNVHGKSLYFRYLSLYPLLHPHLHLLFSSRPSASSTSPLLSLPLFQTSSTGKSPCTINASLPFPSLRLFPSDNKGNSHRSTPLHYNRSVHIIMHDNNRRGLLIWVPRVLCLFVCFRQREREAWPYSFLLPSLVRILWIDNRYMENTGIICRAG